jgi:hypothetical protein
MISVSVRRLRCEQQYWQPNKLTSNGMFVWKSCASPQQRDGYDNGMHVFANAQELPDWTTHNGSLIGYSSVTLTKTKTTVIPGLTPPGLTLTDMLEQQLRPASSHRGVLFAESLRVEIAQDIPFRAAPALETTDSLARAS